MPTSITLVTGALTLFALGLAPAQQIEIQEPSSMIVVQGSAEVAAAPDEALVSLGVTAQAAQAAAAQEQVNGVMRNAIAAIEKLRVTRENIQTAGLSLHPVYSSPHPQAPDDSTPRIVAYRASNTIQVRIQDLSLVGGVIDAGVGAGANEIQGIAFRLRDDTQQRTEALVQAMRNARQKAEAIAQGANATLGMIHRIEESAGDTIYPMAETRMALADGAPVQPGLVRVRASLTATYRFAASGLEVPPRQGR